MPSRSSPAAPLQKALPWPVPMPSPRCSVPVTARFRPLRDSKWPDPSRACLGLTFARNQRHLDRLAWWHLPFGLLHPHLHVRVQRVGGEAG